MKIGSHHLTLKPILLPIVTAGLAAFCVTQELWQSLQTGLLVVLSVISAAVLVRLARGLPFSNPDHFRLEELNRIAAAIHANAQALRVLIFACWLSMGAIIVFSFAQFPYVEGWSEVGETIFSGGIGLLLGFVLARAVQVVESDVAMIALQAQVMANVISRKNAETFEASLTASPQAAIAGAERFGTVIQ